MQERTIMKNNQLKISKMYKPKLGYKNEARKCKSVDLVSMRMKSTIVLVTCSKSKIETPKQYVKSVQR